MHLRKVHFISDWTWTFRGGGGNFPCPNIKLGREVVLRGIMDIGMSPIDKCDPRLADIITGF